MAQRDPKDRRYRERLAGSYLASLFVHALLAMLLFSSVSNSSQEGATESVSGGELVTLEARAPAIAQPSSQPQPAAPMPHAPRIAPVKRAPLTRPAHQPRPPAHPELSKFAPTAPPNPTPLPQATPEPNPQPTQAVYETKPENAVPAVPTSVPAQVSAVTVNIPPTAAPTPAPTVAPTATPKPQPPAPTAAPTAKPQTPAPAAPSPSATASPVAVVAKATAAPSAAPAPAAHASATPAAHQGVPSPSPTQGPAQAKAAGTAPSPGPSGGPSPGPKPGTAGAAKPGAARPVNVHPTPSAPPARARTSNGGNAIDINAKLRAMLPNNPVNPSYKVFHQQIGLHGSLDPTPPPDVIAATKFLFEERGSGNEARVKMWVTAVHRDGPVTMCDGWLVRYPRAPVESIHPYGTHIGDNNGTQIGALPGGTLPPIVEEHASMSCSERGLVPFAASPAPSP